LDDPELEQVETHLLACAVCQDLVVENDAYLPALKSALAEARLEAAPRSTPAWWQGWLPRTPALAGVAAAIALSVVLFRPGDPQPTVGVTLHSERGGIRDLAAQGPAGTAMDLTIQSNSLQVGTRDTLTIVDATGQRMWSGGFDASIAHVRQGLPAGTYWVRLYDPQNQLLQEYGLELH
jgi:hypothetical protein